MTGSLEHLDIGKSRLSYAAAILHTTDLDGLARLHAQLASPQALIAGFRPADQAKVEDWLALIEAARRLRDLSQFDSDVLEAVEAGLPPQLQDPTDAVRPEWACPACGERRLDQLSIRDDDSVDCATCGKHYRPPPAGEGRDA